jgi:Rad3-related DNA helicase
VPALAGRHAAGRQRANPAAAVVCVDEAHRLTRAALDALTPSVTVVAALRCGLPHDDPGALAALLARGSTQVVALEPLGPEDALAIAGGTRRTGTR